jgi:beta-lactamase regulating signal transducer with metallopeptidase domain
MILLLEWTIKTCVIVAIALGASFAMRRSSAAIRHLVWVAAFGTIVLLPLCTLLIPPSLHSNLPAPITRMTMSSKLQYSVPIASVDSLAARATSVRATIVPVSWPVLIWLVGCLASAAILFAGRLRLAWTSHASMHFLDARWARASIELSRAFGLKRRVRLLQDLNTSMPVTWGWLRPRVLLPANAENWTDKQIRVVLSHEFAHIHRHDWAVQMLAEIVRAAYWFNPLLWIACDRLRQEGEHACDDAVLLLGIEGTEYAANILDVARMLKASKRVWSSALTMARPSNLERRFAAMVNPSLDRRGVTRKAFLLTAMSALLIVLPLAALRAQIVPAPVRFSGNVYDLKGTAIPNATIVLTRIDDATQKTTTTSSRTGIFEFTKLAAGHYVVDITREGFAAFHIDDIYIEGAQNSPLNAMLPAQSSIAAIPSKPEPAGSRRGLRASGPEPNLTQQYRIADIKVTGAKAVDEAQIRFRVGLVPGQVYNEDQLRSGLEALKWVYGSLGYVNFVPEPRIDFDEQRKVVNLTLDIDEDRQFRINRINFTGNTTTRDDLIRRELLIEEGQVFNSSLWEQSLARLNQLGYFDEVNNGDVEIKPSPTEPTLDINLRLKEKGRN